MKNSLPESGIGRSTHFSTPKTQRIINALPEAGFVRLFQIIGDPKADPPIPAIIPISKSSWWSGVKQGRYPQPVKLGPRTTAWNVDDIRALIEKSR